MFVFWKQNIQTKILITNKTISKKCYSKIGLTHRWPFKIDTKIHLDTLIIFCSF